MVILVKINYIWSILLMMYHRFGVLCQCYGPGSWIMLEGEACNIDIRPQNSDKLLQYGFPGYKALSTRENKQTTMIVTSQIPDGVTKKTQRTMTVTMKTTDKENQTTKIVTTKAKSTA